MPSDSPSREPSSSPSLSIEPTSLTFATIYEAEDAATQSGVFTKSSAVGYSGNGYADYNGQQGSYVQFENVEGGPGGDCILSFRYALNPHTDGACSVTLNGFDVGTLDFFSTPWAKWRLESLQATCNSGPNNVVRVTAATDNGGPNLDYLEVIDPISYYKVRVCFACFAFHVAPCVE